MFWWLMKKVNFWLRAGWVGSYLQRSLSAQVKGGGPDANTDRWKQPFSVVRVSGLPGNDLQLGGIPARALGAESI